MCDIKCKDCNSSPVHVPVEREMKTKNEFGVVHLFIRKECVDCGKVLGDTMVSAIK